MTAHAPEHDYMSDVASSGTRMYRSVSGQSLGDMMEYGGEDDDQLSMMQQSNGRQMQRRTSETAAGKRNFRSKRFSRNLERGDPSGQQMRRSHSLHGMERSRPLMEDENGDWQQGNNGRNPRMVSLGPLALAF